MDFKKGYDNLFESTELNCFAWSRKRGWLAKVAVMSQSRGTPLNWEEGHDMRGESRGGGMEVDSKKETSRKEEFFWKAERRMVIQMVGKGYSRREWVLSSLSNLHITK